MEPELLGWNSWIVVKLCGHIWNKPAIVGNGIVNSMVLNWDEHYSLDDIDKVRPRADCCWKSLELRDEESEIKLVTKQIS